MVARNGRFTALLGVFQVLGRWCDAHRRVGFLAEVGCPGFHLFRRWMVAFHDANRRLQHRWGGSERPDDVLVTAGAPGRCRGVRLTSPRGVQTRSGEKAGQGARRSGSAGGSGAGRPAELPANCPGSADFRMPTTAGERISSGRVGSDGHHCEVGRFTAFCDGACHQLGRTLDAPGSVRRAYLLAGARGADRERARIREVSRSPACAFSTRSRLPSESPRRRRGSRVRSVRRSRIRPWPPHARRNRRGRGGGGGPRPGAGA